MAVEHAIGRLVQMLIVWVHLVFVAVLRFLLRFLWRAGDRIPHVDQILAEQRKLQDQIDALTREVRDLINQLRAACLTT